MSSTAVEQKYERRRWMYNTVISGFIYDAISEIIGRVEFGAGMII